MVKKEEGWLETTGLQSFADCGIVGPGERKVTLKGEEVRQYSNSFTLPTCERLLHHLRTHWIEGVFN